MADDRLTRVENDLRHLRKKVDNLDNLHLVLTELKTITKYQVEKSDKLDTLVEEQGKTLIEQGKLLVSIHEKMDSYEKHNELIDKKLEDIEENAEEIKSSNSIATGEVYKYVMFAIIGYTLSLLAEKLF